jgi:tRNA threonylcarbamoyladenosine biosynthesis protein TsaB
MNILAMDTATSLFSVALVSESGIESGIESGLWHFEADAGQRHSDLLIDVVDMLVKTAGLKPGDLDLAACMKGPGSFTGLRIGFSAAKGLALALGLPLLAIPTLDCMAASGSHWPGLVLPLIDAKKRRYFTALYRHGERLSDYMDATPAEIEGAIMAADVQDPNAPVLLTGPDAALFLDAVPSLGGRFRLAPDYRKGRGPELAALVRQELERRGGLAGLGDETLFTGPLYLRYAQISNEQLAISN